MTGKQEKPFGELTDELSGSQADKETTTDKVATSEEKQKIGELPEEYKELVEKCIRDTVVATGQKISELKKQREELIAETSIDDVNALERFEKKAGKAFFSMETIRNKFAKVVLALLPLLVLGKLTHLESKDKGPNFSTRAIAAEQLKNNGITDERKTAYKIGLSETLYRSVTPIGYKNAWQILEQLPGNIITDRKIMVADELTRNQRTVSKAHVQERDDTWRLYLGMPQRNNTFGISKYQPASSKENIYYYCINGWLEKFSKIVCDNENPDLATAIKKIVRTAKVKENTKTKIRYNKLQLQSENLFDEITNFTNQFLIENKLSRFDLEKLPPVLQAKFDRGIGYLQKKGHNILEEMNIIYPETVNPDWVQMIEPTYILADDLRKSNESQAGVMGKFKLSVGKDEKGSYISYYDKWDLCESKIEGEKGLFGKPFEIYDRIYYNPVTFEPID